MRLHSSSFTRSAARNAARGFTLLEIMIAISMFMMIIVAIYSCWFSIVRGTEAAMRAADEVQRTRIAIRTVEEALASAVNFQSGRTNYYTFLADTASSAPSLSFVARLPSSFIGSGRYQGAPVRRVTFSVEPGTSGGTQLVLTQRPLLEATELVDQPYRISLVPNLSLFQMEFWDAQMGEWAPEWLQTNQLPRAVRVAIGFGNVGSGFSSRPERITTRVITMAASPVRRAAGPPVNNAGLGGGGVGGGGFAGPGRQRGDNPAGGGLGGGTFNGSGGRGGGSLGENRPPFPNNSGWNGGGRRNDPFGAGGGGGGRGPGGGGGRRGG